MNIDNETNYRIDEEDRNQNYYVTHASKIEKDIYNLFLDREKRYADYTFSFSGIKRMLGGIHQQKLTNALDNLVDENLIVKNDIGYTLNGKFKILGKEKTAFERKETNSINKLKWIARSNQYSFPVKHIFTILNGKWFGKFRFIGYSNNKNSVVLEWTYINSHGLLRLEINKWSAHIIATNIGERKALAAVRAIQSTLYQSNILIQFEQENSYYNGQFNN